MTENTEQNETYDRELPEMTPGSNGMYMISAKDGMEMGPMVLQAFMAKLREAADKAELEVKVEPTQGVLMIWWYPREEPTFLDDLAQHMGAVPAGEMTVGLETIGLTYVELIEGLAGVSVRKQNVINLKDVEGDETGVTTVQIIWSPKAGLASMAEWNEGMDRTNEQPVEEEASYFDRVIEELSKIERGTTRANKSRMMQSVDVESMPELMQFFEPAGQVHQKELRITYSSMNSEMVISWRPLWEKGDAWPLNEGE